jgi:hypothetical protein
MLTYSLRWHGTKRGIQIEGFRATFTTCHQAFLVTKCDRGLVRPEVTFAVFAEAKDDQPGKRLWHKDVAISNTFNVLKAGATPKLPSNTPVASTFPPGSVLDVRLWGFDDWNAVEQGGNQWYRVPGSNGVVILR